MTLASTALPLMQPFSPRSRVVGLVVGGAPLAARTNALVEALAHREPPAQVSLTISEAARAWTTLNPSAWRDPSEPSVSSRPTVYVACPLTFNTANKIRSGIADTPAAAALCEAVGAGTPVLAVPFFKRSLAAHPAWATSLNWYAGIPDWFWYDPLHNRPGLLADGLTSGSGDAVTAAFDLEALCSRIDSLLEREIIRPRDDSAR